MPEKIIGYILLCLGILTILFSGYSVYAIFTKQTEPVKLFNFKGISLNPSQMLAGNLPPGMSLPQNNSSKTEIVSPELLNDSSNIFAHLMLMGFIASIGYKLASLGVQLIRPIVVRLKTKEEISPKI